MRFSLIAVLSGLAALSIVSALPAENLQRGVPSVDVSEPVQDGCCKAVSWPVIAESNSC